MSALPSSEQGRARVLLVDDDAVVRDETARAIERRLGLEVTTAHGAMRALTLLRREPFDVMVVALDMPEMSGVELLQRAGELFPDLITGVFPDLITGVWSQDVDRPGLRRTGASFAVARRERVDALLDALSSVLDIERLPSGLHSFPPDEA